MNAARPRFHFVLGKGGVGRTTTTGALALALRQTLPPGGRVLVVEVDELSTEQGGADAPGNFPALMRAFGRQDAPSPEAAALPRPIAPGIDVARLTASLGHEAFLESSLPGGAMLTGALRSRPIRRFLESAPAFHEMGQMAHLAALVGALGKGSGGSPYAHAVVDLPATGHALALAELPDAARKIIPVGPVARALGEAQALMRDPTRVDVWVVTLPETLPVSETLELLESLKLHGQPRPRIVVNRWPADPFTEAGASSEAREAAARLVSRHPEVRGARAFRALTEATEATGRLPAGLPVLHLPARPESHGLALLEHLAPHLIPGIGALGVAVGAAVSEEIGTSKHVGLAEALQSRRAIICAGAGGVGKTTVSASLALAAARLGRRVLVVTIDPSRRLAETLGVSRHLAEPIALDPARLAALGVHPPGSLDAWMLDPGIVSDRTVESFAQTPDDARRLLANPVYQGLSRMTAGMQEFTAVEAMHTFVTTGRYDLVVLDTPPARNALRFLDAPRRVSAFMDRRIFEAFAPASAGSGLVRRLTGSVVEKVLDVALGQPTRKAVQEFFALFGALLQHLETNQQTMVRFLRSDAVGFVLVTSPHRAAVDEALALEARCRAILGVPLLGRVLNQSLAADDDAAPFPAADLFGDEDAATVAAALPVLTRLAEAEQAEITAHRETAVRLERESGTTWVLPRLPVAASNLEALNALVERVLKA